MTPLHAVSRPAPRRAPPHLGLAPAAPRPPVPPPVLAPRGGPRVVAAVFVALIVLALLLQASFVASLASGAGTARAGEARTAALVR